MNSFLNYIGLLFLGLGLVSCNKDLGNYDYVAPEDPVVTGLDSVYEVLVGDTLRIKPTIQFSDTSQLEFFWRVAIPETNSELNYTGQELVMPFGLGAKRYGGRLSVLNHENEMRYFYTFYIDGKTDFSKGIALLSVENGQTLFSFVKPDGTVQRDLYSVLYEEALPPKPLSLNVTHGNYNPTDIRSYWIICGEGENPGVQLDINTMQRIKYFNDNFYETPSGMKPQNLFVNMNGVLAGVMNNKLYQGAATTWDQFPIYGTFGVPSIGDYELSPTMIFSDANFGADFNIGYDLNRKQMILFNAGGIYLGTGYDLNGAAFDPRKIDLDMIQMLKINPNANYAWGRAADGVVYELKFSVLPNGAGAVIGPVHKRLFAGADKLTQDTKWVATPSEIIYFTSGTQVYRYNPLNEEVRALSADFSGKKLTMLKLADNGLTLIVGADGSVFYLDISTGGNGRIVRTVTDLPGEPIDLFERK